MPCNIRKKFFAELLGTFFLVFFGTGAAVVTLLITDAERSVSIEISIPITAR